MARSPKMGLADKHAIKSMVSEGFTVKKIAQLLKRGLPTIQKYIDEELGGYPQDVEMEEVREPLNSNLDINIINGSINKLVHGGMYRDEATELTHRTIKQVVVPLTTADELYQFCINNCNIRNIMPTKAAGGQPGVAVMTGSASQRMDAKKSKFISKHSRSHIFRQGDDQ